MSLACWLDRWDWNITRGGTGLNVLALDELVDI